MRIVRCESHTPKLSTGNFCFKLKGSRAARVRVDAIRLLGIVLFAC